MTIGRTKANANVLEAPFDDPDTAFPAEQGVSHFMKADSVAANKAWSEYHSYGGQVPKKQLQNGIIERDYDSLMVCERFPVRLSIVPGRELLNDFVFVADCLAILPTSWLITFCERNCPPMCPQSPTVTQDQINALLSIGIEDPIRELLRKGAIHGHGAKFHLSVREDALCMTCGKVIGKSGHIDHTTFDGASYIR